MLYNVVYQTLMYSALMLLHFLKDSFMSRNLPTIPGSSGTVL